LAVERVALTALGVRIVQLVTDDPDAARCPACRVVSTVVVSTSGKDWVVTRPHDLPSGGGQIAAQWRKRRWRCRTQACARQTFTEQVAQVPAGMRTTTRLRTALAVAVEDGRDQSEVAVAHGVSWPTVQRAVVVHGAIELVEPEATTVLGMDETRFRRRGDGPTVFMTAPVRTVGSGGGARIRGRPVSSTSPVIRRCWGRSMGAPVPRCRRGWAPVPRSFGRVSR
jgi:transposase